MASWTLDDIAWERFDATKLDPDLVAVVKAASLVEHNGADYAQYLCQVFDDDPDFQEAARQWGADEIRHGEALGRWAALADPAFDFAAACRRFTAGFRVDLTPQKSVRGSRSGEMVARCMVETGTSSYYSALAEASAEPVLRDICRRIAADEFRHYKLFYATLKRYLAVERLGFWGRLRVAVGRIAESQDDELAYAYYAANGGAAAYDLRRCSRAYARRAYAYYRPQHVERGIGMVFKAIGLSPQTRLCRLASGLAWRVLNARANRLARIEA